jgi:hypothetical protein
MPSSSALLLETNCRGPSYTREGRAERSGKSGKPGQSKQDLSHQLQL